jgi:hypothetical protein
VVLVFHPKKNGSAPAASLCFSKICRTSPYWVSRNQLNSSNALTKHLTAIFHELFIGLFLLHSFIGPHNRKGAVERPEKLVHCDGFRLWFSKKIFQWWLLIQQLKKRWKNINL